MEGTQQQQGRTVPSCELNEVCYYLAVVNMFLGGVGIEGGVQAAVCERDRAMSRRMGP